MWSSRKNILRLSLKKKSAKDDWNGPSPDEKKTIDPPIDLLKIQSSTEECDWSLFDDILAAKSLDFVVVSESFSTGITLHTAIRLRAPETTLIRTAEQFPEMLARVDENGHYPIHVACSFGASPGFVFHCICMNQLSAVSVDKQGRTPIHLLCKNYNSNRIKLEDDSDEVEKDMVKILNMLYQKAPSSVISEDKNGVGAIEYALSSDCGIDFVRTLQGMIAHFNETQHRKEAHRKVVDARRQMKKKTSPFAAFAA